MTLPLFQDKPGYQPLASRMRPLALAGYAGQEHILSPGKPLYEAIRQGQPHSMILWGPPGTGKTTLARMVAGSANAHLETLSAVLSGVKEIRAALERAQDVRSQHGRKRFCSSTRYIASINRSRMRFYRTLKTGLSSSLALPPRTLPSS